MSRDDDRFINAVAQIGNLTLMDQSNNSTNSNKSFEKKKANFAKSRCALTEGSAFGLPSLVQYREFGYNEIEARTKKLGKYFISYFNTLFA